MLNYCSVRFRISNTLESNHVSLILFDIRWLCYFCCGFLNRKQETGNSKHRRANQTVGQMQHVLHFVIGCCYAADGFLLLLPDTADSLSCIVQKFNYNLYFFFCVPFQQKAKKTFYWYCSRVHDSPPTSGSMSSVMLSRTYSCPPSQREENSTGTEQKLLANWLLTLPAPTLSRFYCLIVNVTLSATETRI